MIASAWDGKADVLRRKNYELDRQILLVGVPSDLLYSTPKGKLIFRTPAEILESLAWMPRELADELHAWKDGISHVRPAKSESLVEPRSIDGPGSGRADLFHHLLLLHTAVSHAFAELDHALLRITDRDLAQPAVLRLRTYRTDVDPVGPDHVDESIEAPAIPVVAAVPSAGADVGAVGGQVQELDSLGAVLERVLLDRKRAEVGELTRAVGLLEAQGFDGVGG